VDMTCIKTSEQRHEFVRSVRKLIPEHEEDRITKLVKAVETEEDLRNNNSSSREMMWAVDNPLFHDVVFMVGDGDCENVRRITAHKVVLCARSPYFKALLTGGMKVCLVYLRLLL